MKIEIQLGRVKRDSLVLVDGKEIRGGLLDFDVDVSGEIPRVTLVIWPERLAIKGDENGLLRATLLDLAKQRRPRRTVRRFFLWLLFEWRLLWGLCPACSSDAPAIDSCRVCLGWRGPHPPTGSMLHVWRMRARALYREKS